MTTTATAKAPSVWEDLVDIFISPSQVFARRMGRGVFFVPFLVFVILSGVLMVGTKPLVQPVYDAVEAQQEAAARKARPDVTEEQLAQIRRFNDKFAVVFAIIAVAFAVVLTGLALWLVGKLFDSQQTAGDAMMVSAYSFLPKLLAFVAAAVIGLLRDPASLTSPFSISLGVGFFLNNANSSPLTQALLGRVEVFTIWVTVLLAIGLHVTGRVPKKQAYIAAAIVWVLGAVPGVLGALRQMGG
ncbi:MAG: YIP1 family protein [Gemmatimonadaceae bacterium]|nr:YIP1 family protein [Gemmatimonadaceae bacterium]